MSKKDSNPVMASDTETTEKHRLKEIHEAKRRCENVVFAYRADNADRYEIYGAVQQYILSVYPLLREHREEYLTDEYLGTHRVDRNGLEPFEHDFTGLNEIIDKVTIEIETKKKQPGRGGGTEIVVIEEYVPVHVFINSYMLVSKFIQEIGLGIDVEEDNGPMQI